MRAGLRGGESEERKMSELSDNVALAFKEYNRLRALVERAVQLSGGWREAIVELEDHCSERVRLRNMLAAADQLDEWTAEARKALADPPQP